MRNLPLILSRWAKLQSTAFLMRSAGKFGNTCLGLHVLINVRVPCLMQPNLKLGISISAREMKLSQNQTREYAELEKTGSSEDVRTLSQELKRYGRFLTDSPGDKKKFESITLAFVNNNSDFEVRFHAHVQSTLIKTKYIPNGTIYMIGPFVHLLKKEATAYFCFTAFASRLEGNLNAHLAFTKFHAQPRALEQIRKHKTYHSL